MKKTVSRGTAAALCVLTAAVSLNVSYALMQRQLPDYQKNNAIYGKLGEIRQLVDARYVGTYDPQAAVDLACTGYMVGVGDRWSSYMSQAEYEAYALSFEGRATGIGVYVLHDLEAGTLRVIETYPGSGAAEAGITKGDAILAAGTVTLAADGYNAMVAALQGEPGTTVSVTFRRAATGETVTADLERREVEATMVTGRMLDDTTGYLYFYNFRQHSEQQFAAVLDSLLEQGAQKLIFDVRNNPGGSVESLCEILDPLLPAGTIMTLRAKDGEERVYESDADALDLPMAVLVNAESISAAEFFAAALQEYGKAEVIGAQTIGKGYSQRTYPLSDGSALHLSDQAYFTPEGRSLIGTGVTPDHVVEMPAEQSAALYFLAPEQDAQLSAARKILDEKTRSK